ncbi:MAG: hypothetical protein U9M91_04875 [Chloroflexota bacterium]|nr:hypothetical protein [Chloroflexota bacterium]
MSLVACAPAPTIVDFRAIPDEISAGDTAALMWNVKGADKVAIDGGIGEVPPTGTEVVSPSATTVYTLTATNGAGTTTERVVVAVRAVAPAPEPAEPSEAHEISLADASVILDISSDLPPGFEELDAASEGVSNEDLGLGPDFSETKLFLREDPFNSVLAYMAVVKGRVQQAAEDAYLRDEEQLKEDLSYWLDVGAVEEGMEVLSTDYSVTHPDVGDAAAIVYASIVYDYQGMKVKQEAELLYVREEEAYVAVVSFHMGEGISLEELGRAIVERVHTLKG